MASPQTLSELDRRIVAGWAADSAEHVQFLVRAELPGEPLSIDAIERARAYSRGELDSAGEIRRRFVAFRTPKSLSPAAAAAARSAAQAAGVAHMGAHALKQLSAPGENSSGPLGQGLLTSGELGQITRRLQSLL